MENPSLERKKPHAILAPLPLQGHLIPAVQLAIKLASNGFSIAFIISDNIHHKITQSNPTSTGPTNDDIFGGVRDGLGLDIEYVTVTRGRPVEYDRWQNHDHRVDPTISPFPDHLEVAIGKIVRSRPSVCCLIADGFCTWASTMAKKFGLLYVSFWTEAAMVLDIYFHVHLLKENLHVGLGARKDIIDYIPGIESIKPTDLMSYLQEEDLTTVCHQSIFAGINDAKRADFLLCNTVQELEPNIISAIQAKIPFYAIGPLFPPGFTKSPVSTSLWAESDCNHWLETKPPGSVLYVSFGSYAHIRKEDLVEIAEGIKLSGVNFLWVLRPDIVSSDDPDPLPNGFRDEVCDRGMIVKWTCQTQVLSHCAIGAFLTHCGWNSILESMWCGIPLLCFPLLTDQFTNRKLIVEDWKIGRSLCDNETVTREEVSEKIRILINDIMGCELKEKIKEVKQILHNAVVEGGSSKKNLDDFIKDINSRF